MRYVGSCGTVVVFRYRTIDFVLLLRVEANTILRKNRKARGNR
jgi:hypothetical protein